MEIIVAAIIGAVATIAAALLTRNNSNNSAPNTKNSFRSTDDSKDKQPAVSENHTTTKRSGVRIIFAIAVLLIGAFASFMGFAITHDKLHAGMSVSIIVGVVLLVISVYLSKLVWKGLNHG